MARKLAAALGLAALAIILLTEFTDIDMQLARAAYDPVLREFPLRHAFLAETVGHRYVRNLCVLAGAGVLGAVLFDLRFAVMDPWTRARMRLLALCAVLEPLAVSLLKQSSALSCPWDLAAFNGSQPYFRLFESIAPGAAPGHCWPGGHASGALWMLGLVVFWLPHRPRRAALAGVLLLAIGFGAGWIQQLRGAHFLSHTLWSMWIAAAVTAALWYTMIHAKSHEIVPGHGRRWITAALWRFAGMGEASMATNIQSELRGRLPAALEAVLAKHGADIARLAGNSGGMTVQALQNDAVVHKIAEYCYDALPWPVRVAVKKPVFVEFVMANRGALVVRLAPPAADAIAPAVS